jgi:uncharacterized protein (TIGR03435 family)
MLESARPGDDSVRRLSVLFCATSVASIAFLLAFARRSDAQNEPQHKLTSVLNCPDDSNLPQVNLRLQSADADVATGALAWYEYKAAVITPHDSAGDQITGTTPHAIATIGPTCEGYRAMNISMHVLLENAFALNRDYVVGAPLWTFDENYDVRIVFANETIDAINKLAPAMRIRAEHGALAPFFAERLKLAVHRETRQVPVYELAVGKKGPKFHEATTPNTTGSALTVFMDDHGGYILTGRAARIDTLTVPLQKVLERAVVDRTGLTGLYDFVLTFDPRAQTYSSMAQFKAAHVTASSVYKDAVTAAVDKQLGLKLNPSQDAIEVVTIDHLEKPAKN